MSSFILLTAKGEVKNTTLGDIASGIESALGKALKRAKPPALIGSWSWQKYKLYLYGYKEGRAGTENKHELHTPFDETILFGDACIVASLEKTALKPTSFTSEMYKKFYNSSGSLDDDNEDGVMDNLDEDEDDDEIDLDEDDDDYEDDVVDDDGVPEEDCINQEEDEEEIRPMLRIKPSSGFKKIAKWMHSPELTPENYVL